MYNKNILYDTFNAKYLNYQEVASTFIINNEFKQLITNNHTLLMGPRGCGKTTLLKMLTPTALHFWMTDEDSFKDKIPFTAVYIPTDIQWKNQIAYLTKHLNNHDDFIEKVTSFLINTNIQIELCRTFNSLLLYSSHSKRDQFRLEEDLCKRLIESWKIETPVSPCFDEIELSLYKRVDEVDFIVSSIINNKNSENLSFELPHYAASNFFTLIKLGCKAFEISIGYTPDHRWALCFDELELAPKFFQMKLYSFLRSVDQKFIFKLTTTPLVNIKDQNIDASQDNDFKPLRLWVYDDSGLEQWKQFCERLVLNKINRQFNINTKYSNEIFGDYSLNEIIKNELNIRGNFPEGAFKGSLENLLFKSLSSVDDSFKTFLSKRKIDSDDPIANKSIDNKSIFLKHKVNVLYRYIFKYRTRKNPPINYGIPYLYEITDGNPRAIISIVDDIFSNIYGFDSQNPLISPSKQTEVIISFSKRYFDLIKNHPDSTLLVNGKPLNVATDILKKIGNFIFSKIVKDSFEPSVPTTFIVDSSLDDDVIKLLEHALYLGAIIYLDPIESFSTKGILNKRFRLSYMLTPNFRIPNRVNGNLHLNTMLSESIGLDSQILFEF